MEQIMKFERKANQNEAENNELLCMKKKFSLVICADYQMSKLIPQWGYSP